MLIEGVGCGAGAHASGSQRPPHHQKLAIMCPHCGLVLHIVDNAPGFNFIYDVRRPRRHYRARVQTQRANIRDVVPLWKAAPEAVRRRAAARRAQLCLP